MCLTTDFTAVRAIHPPVEDCASEVKQADDAHDDNGRQRIHGHVLEQRRQRQHGHPHYPSCHQAAESCKCGFCCISTADIACHVNYMLTPACQVLAVLDISIMELGGWLNIMMNLNI